MTIAFADSEARKDCSTNPYVSSSGIRRAVNAFERQIMIPKLNPFELDVEQFGVVKLSVANLRQLPMYQSEMVNQLILGTVVPVFDEQNDFYLVQNWDNYRGWLSKASLVLKSRDEATMWYDDATLSFTAHNGWVRCDPDANSDALTDLVLFSRLKEIAVEASFKLVELPDGRRGYVPAAQTSAEHQAEQRNVTGESIIAEARKFLGIPYLWGGATPKAFDCSGYVQAVFRRHNIALPRDAYEMIGLGSEVPIAPNYDGLRAGDLLFFGKTMRRVTHVAIYVADRVYIHADGTVCINSLDPGDVLYNERRHQSLLMAKRILEP